MKKIFTLFLLSGLFACTNLVERHPDAKHLVQLRDEPIGCQFLYRLEVDTLVYSREDAIRYLENRILDQARRGNAYWLVSIRTRPREWRFFGQERSFVMLANVYRCPEHAMIVTRGDLGRTTEYLKRDWD